MTDKNNPSKATVRSLPPAERRTRIEIAFHDEAPEVFWGLRVPANLARTRFRRLSQDAFRLATPTISAEPGIESWTELGIFKRGGFVALDCYQKARHIHRQIDAARKAGTDRKIERLDGKALGLAWSKATRRINRALVHLENTWAREWPEIETR